MVLVPAGVLHAIGEGVLLVELQEPEDLSILLEWRGFELDGDATATSASGSTSRSPRSTTTRSPPTGWPSW